MDYFCDLEKYKLIKCLIIGGGGFIGSHLVEALINQKYKVRIFNRSCNVSFTDEVLNKIEFIQGNFTNEAALISALNDCDICFHLVSTVLPKSSNIDPIYDIQTNLIGTVKLLDYAVQARVKKIVFLSSGGTVYGSPKQLPIDEDHPTNPLCSYGITKLAIEKYLELYYQLYGLNYIILRLANPYGEKQRTNASQGIIPIFLKKILRNEKVEIWGNGSIIRDYIYISDVVNALIKTIPYQGAERIFNIGSGEGRSINDILETIESSLGQPIKKHFTTGRAFDVPASVLSIDRAKQFLNWHPKISFSEGLKHTMNWLKREIEKDKVY
ncbi:NAD-dependent epimerase/dehydratase family protein [Legionella gresilensis]|uniref:NAD-dependent epimerase/dehydratase family protein n=1 Tax=Legionella gresilensis TaxID=91823 RepID=UPI00104109A7|nr:NAD-dependent epimerase/dehydratase family protein [Legionella gresilensis]